MIGRCESCGHEQAQFVWRCIDCGALCAFLSSDGVPEHDCPRCSKRSWEDPRVLFNGLLDELARVKEHADSAAAVAEEAKTNVAALRTEMEVE